MKKYSELTVITKAKDLANYVLEVTDKSPKKFRFTLVGRLQNLSLDVIENLYCANSIRIYDPDDRIHIKNRKEYQNQAYVKNNLLSYLALIAMEQNCILSKQYEQISIQSAEVNRLLIAWAKSDMNRYKSRG